MIPCEGNHPTEQMVPAATWTATMPTSDSPSALTFLCIKCVEKVGPEMTEEGWVFSPLEVTP